MLAREAGPAVRVRAGGLSVRARGRGVVVRARVTGGAQAFTREPVSSSLLFFSRSRASNASTKVWSSWAAAASTSFFFSVYFWHTPSLKAALVFSSSATVALRNFRRYFASSDLGPRLVGPGFAASPSVFSSLGSWPTSLETASWAHSLRIRAGSVSGPVPELTSNILNSSSAKLNWWQE